MAEGVRLDLLVYHDMTDFVGADLSLMADAGEQLGDTFSGYRVVAVGPPIHPGKDKTVVLAHRRDTDAACRPCSTSFHVPKRHGREGTD